MDIGALLAAADAEVAYDADTFETHEPDAGKEENKNLTTAEILQASAQTVEKEEKAEADEILMKATEQVKDEVAEIEAERNNDGTSNKDLNILKAASEEVQRLDSGIAGDIKRKKHRFVEEEEAESQDEEDDYDFIATKELMFACHNGQNVKVRELLEKHVNICYKDQHGWTPLHWACSKGHVDIAEALIAKRRKQGKKISSYIHIHDKLAGWTPLHVAAVCGQLNIVRLLLDFDVNIDKLDYMGETAFDVVGKVKTAKAIRNILKPEEEKKDSKESKEQ